MTAPRPARFNLQPQVIYLDEHMGHHRRVVRQHDHADHLLLIGFTVVMAVLLASCVVGLGVMVWSVWQFVHRLVGG